MSNSKDVFVNTWPRDDFRLLPSDATFLCSYEVAGNMYEREEHAYFLRSSGTDTLWIRSDFGVVGKAVSRPTASDETTAQLDLLGILFRARVGFEGTGTLISSGAFQSDYVELLADIERELEVNTQSALGRETAVVLKARELGLRPDPTGTDPQRWNANCPGTSHQLLLNTELDEFWCGYCNRNGDIASLAEFVEDRSAKSA